MANKTIPQLPEQTGITDNDVLAIVDSGETTTSKIKVSTLLSGVPAGVYQSGSGSNSIKPVDGTNTASGNFSAVLNGDANTASGEYNISSGRNNLTKAGYGGIFAGRNNTVDTFGTLSSIIAGRDNNNDGKDSIILSSEFAGIKTNGTIIGGFGTYVYGQGINPDSGSFSIYSPYTYIRQDNGTGTNTIKGELTGLIASRDCEINGQTSNETLRSVIIGSNDTDLTGGTTNTLMLGCSGRTGTNSYTTYVETLEAFEGIVLNDYSNLNFSGDTAAATGGVPLGGLYHNAGDLRVRIT